MDSIPGRNLSVFTRTECDFFREVCNFTPDETDVFEMRIRDKSIVQIAMALGMSERTVKRRVAGIKRKIYRVL